MRVTRLISHTADAALPGTDACPRSLACEAQLLVNVEERVDAAEAMPPAKVERKAAR